MTAIAQHLAGGVLFGLAPVAPTATARRSATAHSTAKLWACGSPWISQHGIDGRGLAGGLADIPASGFGISQLAGAGQPLQAIPVQMQNQRATSA